MILDTVTGSKRKDNLWARTTLAEIDVGHRPGVSTSDEERIAALGRENRELRRSNAILRSAAADWVLQCLRQRVGPRP